MKEELLKGLSEEQIAKVKACKNEEELLALAKAEGIELTDEQLQSVTGGGCFSTNKCPKCGSTDYKEETYYYTAGERRVCTCNKCGQQWLK